MLTPERRAGLISLLAKIDQSIALAKHLADDAELSQGDRRTAAYWLSYYQRHLHRVESLLFRYEHFGIGPAMTNNCSRLLNHLADAQQALADAEQIVAQMLDDGNLIAEAREYTAILRSNIERIELLLSSTR
jgi:hypothetical protein